MSAAATKLMQNMTVMTPDQMPVLETKSMKLETLVAVQEERVQRIDETFMKAQRRLEHLRERRRNMGSPRSYLRGVGSNALFKEMGKHNRKRIRILEVDRDRAIKNHDKVKAYNEQLRLDINVMRKNARLADRQFAELKVKLEDVRDAMAADLQSANDIMNFNDEAKETMEMLKEEEVQAQESHDRECEALSAYVSERLERLAFLENGEDDLDLGKLSPSAERKVQKQIDRLATSMRHNATKDAASSKKLHDYQVAFDKLKRVTGITDIRKMVSNFIEVEDRNFGLFRYIQMLNKDAKKTAAQVDAIKHEIQDFNDSHREEMEAKRRDQERRTRDARMLLEENALSEKKYTRLKAEFEVTRKAIRKTFVAIGCGELAVVERRPPSRTASRASQRTVPSHLLERPTSAGSVRSSAHEVQELLREPVTEGNISKYMRVIEQRVQEVCARAPEALNTDSKEAEEDLDATTGTAGSTTKLPKVVNEVRGPTEEFRPHHFHVVLPGLGDDDSDTLDLSTAIPNPITNAMEASVLKMRREDEGWEANGTLDTLLSNAEDGGRPRTESGSRRAAGRDDDVRPVDRDAIIRELAKQFDGPEGLAVSQFIKPGRATKPVNQDTSAFGRRKKRAAARSTTDLSRTAPGGSRRKMRSSKSATAVGRRRSGGSDKRFARTMR